MIYLCLAALGLHCCAWAFSSCGKQGLLSLVVRGLPAAGSPLAVERGLWVRGLPTAGSSLAAECGLWVCGLLIAGSSLTVERELWVRGLPAAGSSLLAERGLWVRGVLSCCGVLSRCRARALGARLQWLQLSDSAAAARGLSCSVACGMSADQESNPSPMQ